MEGGKIYDKLNMGDKLSDDEVSWGWQHFRLLHEMLRDSGPVFKLASVEACRVADLLDDMKRGRAKDRKSGGAPCP